MKLSAFYTALCFTILVSCDPMTTGEFTLDMQDGGFLQTDTTHYQAELQTGSLQVVTFDIPFTITNAKDEPIYMVGCKQAPAPDLQKNVNGEWVTAYSPIHLMCLSPPFIVEPFETFHDTLRVYGALPGQNTAPTFDTDIDGTYRLVQNLHTDPDSFDDLEKKSENLLPEALRISNNFVVRRK